MTQLFISSLQLRRQQHTRHCKSPSTPNSSTCPFSVSACVSRSSCVPQPPDQPFDRLSSDDTSVRRPLQDKEAASCLEQPTMPSTAKELL